ncbi:MAG: hypothetical protein ACXWYS_09230 [Gaiellaceae bacterium]
MRRHSLLSAAVVAVAFVLPGTAFAKSLWPGLARSVSSPNGELRYVAQRSDGKTTVVARRGNTIVASRTVRGRFDIPAVTTGGLGGGLSPDGKTLVLVDEPRGHTYVRTRSRFVLMRAPGPSPLRTIELAGDFAFDALAGNGRTLYLLEHANPDDHSEYRVRALDLRTNRLVARVVVDKREPDERMIGSPAARATTVDGKWVYALYTRSADEPFVHALDTNTRAAYCIDLPWTVRVAPTKLSLSRDERRLTVRTRHGVMFATIDLVRLRLL